MAWPPPSRTLCSGGARQLLRATGVLAQALGRSPCRALCRPPGHPPARSRAPARASAAASPSRPYPAGAPTLAVATLCPVMPQPVPPPLAPACPHSAEGGARPLRGGPQVRPRPPGPGGSAGWRAPCPALTRASLAEAAPEQRRKQPALQRGPSWSRPSKGPWHPGLGAWPLLLGPCLPQSHRQLPGPARPPGTIPWTHWPDHHLQRDSPFPSPFLSAPRVSRGGATNAGPGRPPQSLGRGGPPLLQAGPSALGILQPSHLSGAPCPWPRSEPGRGPPGGPAAAPWWPEGRQGRAPGAGARPYMPHRAARGRGGQEGAGRVGRPPGHQEHRCGGSEGPLGKY